MKKIVFLVMALWGLAAADAAPLPRIKGKIVEAGSNNPVDMADVFLLAEGSNSPVAHALPAEDGSFAFAEDVRDGTYTLMVRLVGYDVYTQAGIVLNGSGQVNLGNIALKALEVGIANVEVVARKKQVIYKLDKKVVEASASLLASGGTAVDILENTPSIRVDAEGEVTFRGSSGFAVYVDGKPSLYSGSQALQQIPSSRIENIEIITTPSARHDTGGDVGIINIITKKDAQLRRPCPHLCASHSPFCRAHNTVL
ncbi:hypothetical protein FACS189438_3200 [Bacteroidia bacterium]|nr:hypothetical protein FACS189438_3200 [Bacteroidia bacterium]